MVLSRLPSIYVLKPHNLPEVSLLFWTNEHTNAVWGAVAVGINLRFGISFKDNLFGAVIKLLTFIMVTSRATVILTVVLRVSYAPALTRCCKTAVSPENQDIPGTAVLHYCDADGKRCDLSK